MIPGTFRTYVGVQRLSKHSSLDSSVKFLLSLFSFVVLCQNLIAVLAVSNHCPSQSSLFLIIYEQSTTNWGETRSLISSWLCISIRVQSPRETSFLKSRSLFYLIMVSQACIVIGYLEALFIGYKEYLVILGPPNTA